MSKIEVNTVEPQCGTTLTLGGSGDTVSLGSGASQSGFGRTGTVDWVTTIQTSTITVADGKGYFVNTTGGAITANLPAGAAGKICAFKDYLNTWDSNALTVSPNGSDKIGGAASDAIFNTESQSVTLIYTDSTRGWIDIHDSTSNAEGATFITATVSGSGNTLTTVCTDYKVAKFTGPGTFTVCSVGNAGGSNTVSYMVVGGGASGGMTAAGGGGAGGFREGRTPQCNTWTASPLACTTGSNNGLPVSAQGYPIVVGAGGAGTTTNPSPGSPGNVSSFSTISSAGGGSGGGGSGPGSGTAAGSGGSGGGGQAGATPANPAGGAGNTPPVSPPQGSAGGSSPNPSGGPAYAGAGGGGATAAGQNGSGSPPYGDGGAGATTSISGTPTAYAGGGGGSADANNPGEALGGTGGGGVGGIASVRCAGAGTINTGGGSGALAHNNSSAVAGGSGIVIIRYKFQ